MPAVWHGAKLLLQDDQQGAVVRVPLSALFGTGDAQLMQVRCIPCGALVVRKGMVKPAFSIRVRTTLYPMGRLITLFVEVTTEMPDRAGVHWPIDNRSLPIPIGRPGTPDDIAQVAVALLSERFGRYVVGTTVEVDGGLGLMSWIPAKA